MTSEEIYSELRQCAPDIEFSARRELDENCKWDGDGPDPIEDGFSAYDVIVTARCVAFGQMLEGEHCLGASYFRDDEEIGDIHGYLPQMLEDAACELLHRPITTQQTSQLQQARQLLNAEMQACWQAQQEAKIKV